LFGEGLAGLDTSSSLRGTEDREGAGIESVDQACRKWSLRAYYCKVNGFSEGKFQQPFDVFSVDLHILTQLSSARVPRSDE
jgi:hypothetical protein